MEFLLFAAEAAKDAGEDVWANRAIMGGMMAIFSLVIKWLLNTHDSKLTELTAGIQKSIAMLVEDSKSERKVFTEALEAQDIRSSESLQGQRTEFREELKAEREICQKRIDELSQRLDGLAGA